MAERKVAGTLAGQRTIDGAGVLLTRIFANQEAGALDPFLLLDNFGSGNPADYLAGFPWHPHRGIETVTYMIAGEVGHHDSLGNRGTIRNGEVQWMTAGSGIIHEEMPKKYDGTSLGFQLWVNLPAREKMCKPAYRGISAAEIPEVGISDGVMAKVICGKIKGKAGPVHGLAVDVEYMDVAAKAGKKLVFETNEKHNAFAYVYEGDADFSGKEIREGTLALFGKGDGISLKAGKKGAKFIFASGTPLREPIAWGGPIVMNTQEELQLAFEELRAGTFIKAAKKA